MSSLPHFDPVFRHVPILPPLLPSPHDIDLICLSSVHLSIFRRPCDVEPARGVHLFPTTKFRAMRQLLLRGPYGTQGEKQLRGGSGERVACEGNRQGGSSGCGELQVDARSFGSHGSGYRRLLLSPGCRFANAGRFVPLVSARRHLVSRPHPHHPDCTNHSLPASSKPTCSKCSQQLVTHYSESLDTTSTLNGTILQNAINAINSQCGAAFATYSASARSSSHATSSFSSLSWSVALLLGIAIGITI